MTPPPAPDPDAAKAAFERYLRVGRDAVLWKLDGLGEYDVRRPMTRTGTNLLGLVKHVASMGCLYLGDVFDRPRPDVSWLADGADDDADQWATADESRAMIVEFWHESWAAADAALRELPLTATGVVPWWPPPVRHATLHRVLVHLCTEVDRHAGHADIVRELIDGRVGMRPDNDNLAGDGDWDAHRERLERIARDAR